MGVQNFERDNEEAIAPRATNLNSGVESSRRQNQVIERCTSDAWFLGPKAEQGELWESLLTYVFRDYVHWRRNYYPGDPVTIPRRQKSHQVDWVDELHSTLDRVLGELKAHFPFYSPRYIGHMLSEQTLPSVIGYFAGMLYNPNNVTAEAAPVTVALELEVGKMVSEMLGFSPQTSWAHLCGGGTLANLEALWVARTVQFAPLVARELCREQDWDFSVVAAPRGGGSPLRQDLRQVDDRELLCLSPGESLPIFRRLAQWATQQGLAADTVLARINGALQSSPYSVPSQGYATVAARVGLKPVLWISEAAHYSLAKAADVLGYGKNAVRPIAVNERFQADWLALSSELEALADNEYPAALIMIAGTTEEGAVDPIHRAVDLRERLWAERGLSFWMHVDAAWGGYMSCLLRGGASGETSLTDFVSRTTQPRLDDAPLAGPRRLAWDDSSVHAALGAMSQVDSVTIDPHKMGYVPYPAGMVAYSSGLVTELIQQKAQYISEESGGLHQFERPVEITAVGPYTLEGSRPGAAAASVWLSHKLIPLCREGHGKIIRDSLLAARTLAYYLNEHDSWHDRLAVALGLSKEHPPCTFSLLYEPDTNVVCFLAFPAAHVAGRVIRTDLSLEALNALNQQVYAHLSLRNQPPAHGMSRVYSYSQPFFVSRTWITPAQYRLESVGPLLRRLRLSSQDYLEHGLFVLRSTVMNPLLLQAADQGKDYILEFLMYLQATTSELLKARE